jgi:hypothetical protein
LNKMQTSNDGSVRNRTTIIWCFQKYSSFEYTANCIYELDRLIKSMKNIWIIVVRTEPALDAFWVEFSDSQLLLFLHEFMHNRTTKKEY